MIGCAKKIFLLLLTATLLFYLVVVIARLSRGREVKANEELKAEVESLASSDLFKGIDNVTGADHFIVPNIVHFIRYQKKEYSFVDYVCLRAAYRNQRPHRIYIHTDVDGGFQGRYWDLVKQEVDLMARIELKPIKAPTEIFGQRLNKQWRFWHGSDLGRIRVMMEYGGIYVDNDVYIIQSLDKYRKYEIAMNWDEGQFLGSQTIVAHKNARFLALWLSSYRYYRRDLWYYNAGQRPTTEILYHHPELIHRVKIQFGADEGISKSLYTVEGFNWKKLDAVHLEINHRHYMDPHYKKIPTFDEINIQNYTFPFGEMAREVYNEVAGAL